MTELSDTHQEIQAVLDGDSEGCIVCGESLGILRDMPDNSIDLVATDPPYYRVKGLAWDRQWDSPEKFIGWIGELCEQWQRILKPNGSLYCFASPKMAARVEVEIGRRLNVVNTITWAKPKFATKAEMFRKGDLRSYFPASERIIFAEHYGADNMAKGEAGYVAKCDELRGFVFEPLRAYLAGEWERASLTPQDANKACGNQMSSHYLTRSQWTLPTAENYAKLQARANANGGEYLRREYEDLRREYEELRRPFSVTADVPYTDVWDFPTVQHYPGKHPCEKPLAMMEHIITASSRPGAVVLDCFAGSGVTCKAASNLGRKFLGIELDAGYCETARRRLQSMKRPPPFIQKPSKSAQNRPKDTKYPPSFFQDDEK